MVATIVLESITVIGSETMINTLKTGTRCYHSLYVTRRSCIGRLEKESATTITNEAMMYFRSLIRYMKHTFEPSRFSGREWPERFVDAIDSYVENRYTSVADVDSWTLTSEHK